MNLKKWIRRKLVSPMISAICESIDEDRDLCWVESRRITIGHSGCAIEHKSGGFRIVRSMRGVYIQTRQGQLMNLKGFEAFFIIAALKGFFAWNSKKCDQEQIQSVRALVSQAVKEQV